MTTEPGVADVATPEAHVLVQQRRVVAKSPWLVAFITEALTAGRQGFVVTPPHTALTHATASLLAETGTRWIVDGGKGPYDGFGGRRVAWTGRTYELGEDLHPDFTPQPDVDLFTLTLTLEVLHPMTGDLTVGGVVAEVLETLELDHPLSCGVVEPTSEAFSPDWITESARAASPEGTTFVVVAPRAEAVVRITPEPVGILERVDIEAALERPLTHEHRERLAGLAVRLGARYLMVGYHRAVGGRYVPPRLTGPVVPHLMITAETLLGMAVTEAAEVAGDEATILPGPPPALRLDYDLPERAGEALQGDGGRDSGPEDNPIMRHYRFAQAVAERVGVPPERGNS
ncbi:hypothetical protein BCF74_10330 [Knoellia remsis]|uniref:Uncharacterized protein n=1 Tax=Knoellia remsis TaxID=407159 RepID=A0A2T0UY14_9MICO|nr:DUF6177 family protein [Knoellia remsis]PRY62823.1 hypothetical protein BCF74_10330 [Knoellia remsis]